MITENILFLYAVFVNPLPNRTSKRETKLFQSIVYSVLYLYSLEIC